MSLANWSDIIDICNQQSTFSSKRINYSFFFLNHLLKRKKEDVEGYRIVQNWPGEFGEQRVLKR